MSKETIKAITGDRSKEGSFQEIARSRAKLDRKPKEVSEKDAVKSFEKQSGYKDTMVGREGF